MSNGSSRSPKRRCSLGKKIVPIYLSSELYPVMQDFARLNTVTIEAYAAEPSRGQFQRIANRAKDFGGQFELRVMASHGGTISTEAKELARTLISGPIGGMVGSRHLGHNLGRRQCRLHRHRRHVV